MEQRGEPGVSLDRGGGSTYGYRLTRVFTSFDIVLQVHTRRMHSTRLNPLFGPLSPGKFMASTSSGNRGVSLWSCTLEHWLLVTNPPVTRWTRFADLKGGMRSSHLAAGEPPRQAFAHCTRAMVRRWRAQCVIRMRFHCLQMDWCRV